MQHIAATKAFKERSLVLKGADLATQHGWTGVPNFILENKRVSVGAKMVYAMLLKYAREEHECFPGQGRLADDLGSGERSVRRWLGELEKEKFITVKQRGQGKTNLYTVYIKASFWGKKRK
jgi:hypothetical protein